MGDFYSLLLVPRGMRCANPGPLRAWPLGTMYSLALLCSSVENVVSSPWTVLCHYNHIAFLCWLVSVDWSCIMRY